jgi:hypothetical protein
MSQEKSNKKELRKTINLANKLNSIRKEEINVTWDDVVSCKKNMVIIH